MNKTSYPSRAQHCRQAAMSNLRSSRRYSQRSILFYYKLLFSQLLIYVIRLSEKNTILIKSNSIYILISLIDIFYLFVFRDYTAGSCDVLHINTHRVKGSLIKVFRRRQFSTNKLYLKGSYQVNHIIFVTYINWRMTQTVYIYCEVSLKLINTIVCHQSTIGQNCIKQKILNSHNHISHTTSSQ